MDRDSRNLIATEDHIVGGEGSTVWQRKLLPFMAAMVVLLAIFAAVSNFYQARVMQQYIAAVPEVDLNPAWESTMAGQTSTFADRFALAQWRTLALLESQAIRSRYHEARVIIMGRVYMVFLGFSTGVVMALIGAAFILGKLHESVSSVTTEAGSWRVALQSSSPGLFLAFFGTVLILATIWSHSDVSVLDRAVYVSARLPDISVTASGANTASRTADEILEKVRRAENEKPPEKK